MIGIPTIIAFFISLGKNLKTLESIENDVRDVIKPDLKDIRERFAALEGKTAQLFAASSPIALLPKGIEILESTGFKKYIDENKKSFLDQFSRNCDMKNQYDIQEKIFQFFDTFNFGNFEDVLKKASFEKGTGISTIRRIGAIYFRDLVLKEAGFTPDDLDKPKLS